MIVSGTNKIHNNLIALELNEYILNTGQRNFVGVSVFLFTNFSFKNTVFLFVYLFLVDWHLEVVKND